jgi:1-acyl-sn-glycerol-3-phosphate acyltransferase
MVIFKKKYHPVFYYKYLYIIMLLKYLSLLYFFILKYLAIIILYFMGWKRKGEKINIKKSIIFSYPHTTNWDGIITILMMKIYNDTCVIKGESLIYRIIANIIGAIHINRNKKSSKTDLIADIINKKNKCNLYISPEGTRKKNNKIKSGFYYIAKKTNVPIICGALDYRTKEYSWSKPIYVKDLSYEETVKKIRDYYVNNDLYNSAKYIENITPLN